MTGATPNIEIAETELWDEWAGTKAAIDSAAGCVEDLRERAADGDADAADRVIAAECSQLYFQARHRVIDARLDATQRRAFNSALHGFPLDWTPQARTPVDA